jgi:biopolymer transport protein ExbD
MNLKIALQRKLRGHSDTAELNLTSVMNVFLIIIPFLLLTASFVKIAVLDMSLPSLDTVEPAASIETKPKSAILNILLIRETGFELKSPDLKFAAVEKISADYNWQVLREQLAQVKQTWPQSDEIIISPENSIHYDVIIHVMDRCREAGFPNISISG